MSGREDAGKEPAASAGSRHVTGPVPGALAEAREAAFRRYVEPEIAVLLRVAYTLTGSWPDAEDVVQDALIRAWRAADRFDGAHPRAWLLTILRRANLNSVRRQRPDLVGDLRELDGQRPAFGASTVIGPEQRHTDREVSAPLADAVAGLDERFRTVLLLVDVDQLTYAEAADVLDIPLGTVMSRLSRARDRLRRQLRPYEGTVR